MAWTSLVSFLHVGPSPTILFWPHVPWDVPTTEGREIVQPRAGSQNEKELSVALALHKTCENVASITALNPATNLAENGQCF